MLKEKDFKKLSLQNHGAYPFDACDMTRQEKKTLLETSGSAFEYVRDEDREDAPLCIIVKVYILVVQCCIGLSYAEECNVPGVLSNHQASRERKQKHSTHSSFLT